MQSTLDLRTLKANKNIAARNYWKNRLEGLEYKPYFTEEWNPGSSPDGNSAGNRAGDSAGNGTDSSASKWADNSADTPANDLAGKPVGSSAGNSTGRPAGKKYAEFTAAASPEVSGSLNGIAGSDKARHVVLLAALGVLVHKYSFVEDVCAFSPLYAASPRPHTNGPSRDTALVPTSDTAHLTVSDRPAHPSLDTKLTPSSDTVLHSAPETTLIPVRMNGFSTLTFPEFLMDLKTRLMTDFTHGDYPLSRMLAAGNPAAQPGKICTLGMLIREIQEESAFAELQPDILFIFSTGGSLSLKIKYNLTVYDAGYINLLPELFFGLLHKLIHHRDKKIGEIEWVSDQEKQKITTVFNKTDWQYPAEMSLIGLFEALVRKIPRRTAIESKGRKITYGELNRRVNQLTRHLLAQGVKKEVPVAMLLERSEDFIIGMLAVLKAGCLYLPIDKDLPEERVRYFVEDSGAKWLLTKELYLEGRNPALPVTSICIDRDQKTIAGFSTRNPPAVAVENIYLLYTSGSTGNPKGVIGTQKGLLNRLYWGWETYPFADGEVGCQKTNPGFVDHLAEIFSPLLKGVPLVIFSEEETKDIQKMISLIGSRKISRITLVPSLLKELIRIINDKKPALDTLRYVFSSGEALPFQLAKEFYQLPGQTELVNIYGSTEVSADVTSYHVDKAMLSSGGKVPIGKPLFNTKIFIVDRHLRLLPVGVPGEILVAGEAVSPGYLRAEELNREKFPPNPFDTNTTVFRSGDLGKWLPDGNIEYLGRLDHQVKIRGNRVRLDEVGEALTRHALVTTAVVIAKDAGNDAYLVGYYTGEEIKAADWRLYLARSLPEYMIPAYFVRLNSLPLTPSGKLDRNALPKPEIQADANYQAPSGELEVKLVEIWARILKLDKNKIGVNASFFELGGHSLRAMTLVNIIQGELGMEVSIRNIFDYKDIASLAKFLESSDTSLYTHLKKAEQREYYPLSIAQLRLQYFYELDRHALTFNLPAVVKLEGVVDKRKILQTFRQLIARQDVLRTSFEMVNDHPVQLIAGHCDFQMEYFQAEEDKVESLVRSFIRPFDLRQPPLFRAGLIEVTPSRSYLMVDMHHIISDGTSIGLLIRDFISLYCDIDLPPVEYSYKDYAVWQQSAGYQQKIARQKEFWVNEFSDPLTPLDIPVDFARPSTTEGDSVRFDLSPEESRQVRALAEQEVATISMLILSVLTVMLSKIARQEDIVIGMVVAGREQVELDNMIGMFPLVLPLRVYPRATLSFRELLGNLKSTFLSTFDNQSYPYEELARELNLERTTGRNPWFDVMYLYQNFETAELVLPGLKISGYAEQNIAAYEKLNLTVSENEEQIFLKLVYSKALFRKETIERWTGYFRTIIKAMLTGLDTRIADVELITAEEKAALLYTPPPAVERRMAPPAAEGRTGTSDAKSLTAATDADADRQYDRLFSELFASQAQATPEAVAAAHGEFFVTYKDLYDRSARLASRLIAAGVGPGQNVAVLLPRSIDMLTGMLSILHSGGTYVPMDIDYPDMRIRDILHDSQSAVVITSRLAVPDLKQWEDTMAFTGQIIYIDAPAPESALETAAETPPEARPESALEPAAETPPEARPEPAAESPAESATEPTPEQGFEPAPLVSDGKSPDDLAYIIYTSGTTGKPKGVMIHQRGMVNHLYALIETLNLDGNDIIAQTASPCFDISVWQLLAALITGGRVHIVDKETLQDPYLLLDELQRAGITVFQSVPTLIGRFIDELRQERKDALSRLRWVIPTGEALPVSLAAKWYAHYPDIPLLNAYGPAEASDDITTYVVEPPGDGQLAVPVGKPVRNMRVYILDEFLHLCPPGVKGEICVAGPGVGKGYWNDPEKTKKVFVPNPFAGEDDNTHSTVLYKTGDLGYYLPDHNIVYAGRKDDQVKIRGHRVELGEIEYWLLQHGSIREASVLVKEWAAEKYLVAYYVADGELPLGELNTYLSDKLPVYMVPAYFVHLSQFPLTINGKLDKRALPDPDVKTKTEYIPPVTDMQRTLVELWAAVLKISGGEISIDASFFYLGGHSLSVITLINKMRKQFNIKIPVKDFFMRPTIRQTAEYLEALLKKEAETKQEPGNTGPAQPAADGASTGQPVYEVTSPYNTTPSGDYEEIKL